MSRPVSSVLPESALIPNGRLVAPAPNQFTHEVASDQPCWFSDAEDRPPSGGVLKSGTPVVLMRHEGGRLCWVVDGQGLYVAMEHAALRKR